jgi:biopolymer transport protein ExbB/TolQ
MERGTPTYNVLGKLSKSTFSSVSLVIYILLLATMLFGIWAYLRVISARSQSEEEVRLLRNSCQRLQTAIDEASKSEKVHEGALKSLDERVRQLEASQSGKKKAAKGKPASSSASPGARQNRQPFRPH